MLHAFILKVLLRSCTVLDIWQESWLSLQEILLLSFSSKFRVLPQLDSNQWCWCLLRIQLYCGFLWFVRVPSLSFIGNNFLKANSVSLYHSSVLLIGYAFCLPAYGQRASIKVIHPPDLLWMEFCRYFLCFDFNFVFIHFFHECDCESV